MESKEDFRDNLSKKVETNAGKPNPVEVEPAQNDFRNVLRKSVKTKSNEHFKPEQIDFRNQLKNKS